MGFVCVKKDLTAVLARGSHTSTLQGEEPVWGRDAMDPDGVTGGRDPTSTGPCAASPTQPKSPWCWPCAMDP